MLPSSRRLELLSRYLPVALLVAVAFFQMSWVLTRDLTRWKGGGFGMFSTADTPFARFLRVRLVTGGVSHPVVFPPSLRELAQKARVMPTQERIDELKRKLNEGTWVQEQSPLLDPESKELLRQRLSSVADDPMDDVDSVVEEIDQICQQRVVKMRNIATYRMLDPTETRPAGSIAVKPQSIQLDLWRYRFEDRAKKLIAWKQRSASNQP